MKCYFILGLVVVFSSRCTLAALAYLFNHLTITWKKCTLSERNRTDSKNYFISVF